MRTTCLKHLCFFCLLINFSCKKISFDTQYPIDNTKLIEVVASEWYQKVKSPFSSELLKITDSIVLNLDYSINGVHPLANGSQVYLIKIKSNSTGISSFLAFTRNGNLYHTIGIIKLSRIESAKETATIFSFIDNNILPQNARLSFYKLNGKHFTSFEMTNDGDLKQFKLIYKPASSKNSNAASLDGCIDWYIVTTYTYSDGTSYQTEQYVGTTCNGGSCGTGDPNAPIYDECLPEDGGGGGGMGWGLISVFVDSVSNHLTDPCLQIHFNK